MMVPNSLIFIFSILWMIIKALFILNWSINIFSKHSVVSAIVINKNKLRRLNNMCIYTVHHYSSMVNVLDIHRYILIAKQKGSNWWGITFWYTHHAMRLLTQWKGFECFSFSSRSPWQYATMMRGIFIK